MIYFTSDTHFGHHAIIGYSNRPFATVEEMDETLIANWNKVVGPDDHVFHLGDVCFHTKEPQDKYLSRLNGRKHLIVGNHDFGHVTDPALWDDDPTHYREIAIDLHGDLVPAHRRGKHDVHVVLCHYPMRQWNRGQWGSWMLHGHTHGTIPSYTRSFDVGVDCWEYAPVPLKEVMARSGALHKLPIYFQTDHPINAFNAKGKEA